MNTECNLIFQYEMRNLKEQLRRNAYNARNLQENQERISQIITEQLLAFPAYQHAKTVMWYISCRSEVRTTACIQQELRTMKQIVIPYCTTTASGENRLGLWWLQAIEELVPGTWGILEPPKQRWGEITKEISPNDLDCIIVPGVAFDRQGGRVGNGAGYYDRLLASVRKDCVLIGAGFESQLVDQVCMEPHDVPMDYIITEKLIYTGRGRAKSSEWIFKR